MAAVVLIYIVQCVGFLVVQLFCQGSFAGIVALVVLVDVYPVFLVVALFYVLVVAVVIVSAPEAAYYPSIVACT